MKTAWFNSIRTKIFVGCISLTFVTIGVGILSQGAQIQLSRTALGIYDNAFQSMNYLRSAQTIILGISRDIASGGKDNAVFVDQVQSALDALEVARERAMSLRGEAIAEQLFTAISDLRARLTSEAEPPVRRHFQAIEEQFEVAVATYSSDGFHLRRSAEGLVATTEFQISAAILGSIATAFAITLMLSRTIVPPIRRAVTIASAIASGRLDNTIEGHGTSETWMLLGALATMQRNIADKIARIEMLMAQQASSHGLEIASQNARFETALDHMTLGLRMFDADQNLVVQNRRFAEMFASDEAGADGATTRPVPLLEGPDLAAGIGAGPRSYHRSLADGRTIAVVEETMVGGGRVVTYEDITERQRAETNLSHMVRHDSLTGLPNRVLFHEHLQRELGADGPNGIVSLLCLDLDRFKMVNDTLGHPVGDALLREAAARLLRTAGENGMVVRLGGDEFAVVLSGLQDDRAAAVAERLIAAFATPFDIDEHRIAIGVSVGIAETSDGAIRADDLLKNADLALYAAKGDGRGIYRFFEPAMDACVQDRRRMELDLMAAVGERQFELHYQPLLSAASGEIIAFEALLRWNHPRRGLVPPSDFIPLAEEAGLISTIGLWVLDRACRDALTWPEGIKVAVNLSPLQFQYRNLVSDVDDVLRRSGLDPARLDLEITESLMLQNCEATMSALHDLRAMGIGISMDDFGTGYSSLSYLRQFPFDKIKIDRSFIRDMVGDSDGLAIVEAVIRLGQSLRMNVVAEGVETLEQKTLLREAGCQELQGYLFSKPLPADRLEILIDQFKLRRAA